MRIVASKTRLFHEAIAVTPPETLDTAESASGARQLLTMINASWMAQAIRVAAYLRIADLIASGERTDERLSLLTGAHQPSLRRLMRALTTLDICVEHDHGTYDLTQMGSLLRADVPNSLRSWALYWGGSAWPVWGQLLDSVMSGESARLRVTGSEGFDAFETDPDAAATFNRAMVELTRLDSANILGAYDFSDVRQLVDVGGGYGELLATVLRANPRTLGVLFDRSHAVESARAQMLAAGVEARCSYIVGDFFLSVPSGADAYLLKSIIHDWDDERSLLILRNCRAAMDAHAKLLLVERIMPMRLEASPGHQSVARSDLNMLVGLNGKERTEDEYRGLLAGAGLKVVRVLPAGPVFGIVEAIRVG
jgi:hypothetical protein